MIVTLEIPGAPVPKGRPRRGRHGFYTPERTRQAEDAIAMYARVARERFTGPVRVELDFYGGRGDIDNLAKTVLDGLQKGGMLSDDRQVQRLRLRKHPAGGHPRTVAKVEALKTTYSAWCVYCDKFWQEHPTLKGAREAQLEHVRMWHPDKEETMTMTAEAPAAVDGSVDPPADAELEAELAEPTPGQLALPGIDGIRNDWIELAVSGRIPLDKNNPDHCALVRKLVAGRSVDLDVSGYVVGRVQKLKRDEETGDEVTFTTTVKVTELRREAPFS